MTQAVTQQFDWKAIATRVLEGVPVSRDEALAIVRADDDELLDIMHAAFLIRKKYYGKKVKLNMIINAKSGLCPEDCGYCSQSIVSEAPVDKYAWLTKEKILEGAQEAIRRKAGTYCIVASGRRPTDKEIDHVADAVKEIRETTDLKICCCLGFLNEEHASKLAAAGVHRYNHNLNTSAANYSNITSTHTYEDRVDTVRKVKESGISPCSGAIFGMGESEEEAVEIAFALRDLDADSIPCNFLNPVDGTPLEGRRELTPRKCLKLLAMMRFVNPSKEIRIAGGREVNLRHLQAMGLYAANSIFVGDYLTTAGQEPMADWQMIEDLGFEIEECAL
ncbi:biotin synthase BioB [Effusibacillus lacus]|uniref:Biotin synthase n=1 Tax=Effusibacillus lacus TaxID=1348429 RepID=A0A292YEB1_9BACL|nr:biotin synthase BioB [Effusibacillus lacus]TCS76995.1 biotin synthase [Effusibacillus lacus]GAX91322.1 biotin synthase BioB [Effusibacillus lacus]